jgi:hypothetical protein
MKLPKNGSDTQWGEWNQRLWKNLATKVVAVELIGRVKHIFHLALLQALTVPGLRDTILNSEHRVAWKV